MFGMDTIFNMKILFVENHERFAKLVVKKLLAAHNVIVVPSLQLARQELDKETFDVVLIDYDLDDGKGSTLVGELAHKTGRPYLIAVSSHMKGNNALLKAGVDAVCCKEEIAKIESMLNNLIEKREL
jgi:DNA-binding response OmpR family regulator